MLFTSKDILQIKLHGLSEAQVQAQLEIFKKRVRLPKIIKPAKLGDGIQAVPREKLKVWTGIFNAAALKGRITKFVPASGAASRMFALPLAFYHRSDRINLREVEQKARRCAESTEFLKFLKGLKSFAFFDDLKRVMSEAALDIEDLIARNEYKAILDFLLFDRGLNYSNLPKALLKFHRYQDHARTPIEEHVMEAMAYAEDRRKSLRVHFTVSPEFAEPVEKFLGLAKKKFTKQLGVRLHFGVSFQKPSTDTMAVDLSNKPFRDEQGNLVFRPGGHGALLENLNDLKGDIVFIKNIDNICCDRYKHETFLYKRALGGYLILLQKEIFAWLKRLERNKLGDKDIEEAFSFLKEKLSVRWPSKPRLLSRREKVRFLFSRLNRPLRVCGMVRNTGEPGGGPFWVEFPNRDVSLQILESTHIHPDAQENRKSLFKSATHFNPVDIICGLRDFRGKPFNLFHFHDANDVFISVKSKDGKNLKALERPGLWNGGMAYWNTVFLEVPLSTFNPVKTVNDLLRKEHQCG